MGTGAVKVAILGSGNIGSDLMYKLLKHKGVMELALLAGIDAASDGLARARAEGVAASHGGIQAVLDCPDVELVFDATSARAHAVHAPLLRAAGKMAIDLTPAAVGPSVVPPVNLGAHLDATNINLITCGGQATIPIVHAVSRVTAVQYAEMVSTVASLSAGPGTRQNIDEFTFTTSRGLETIGGAKQGKAIIILNPAAPPILMRNTIYVVPRAEEFDAAAIIQSVESMVAEVQAYVPGYRLKSAPVTDRRQTPWGARTVIVILLEVEGAGDYLPPYAGQPRHHDLGGIPRRGAVRPSHPRTEGGTIVKPPRLVDSTLRDGSHAMAHQFTRAQVRQVVTALDAAGIPVIEVSHGDGLAGSSLQYGFSGTAEMDLIEEARSAAHNAKIAGLLLPGSRHARGPEGGGLARHPDGPRRHAVHRGRRVGAAFRHGEGDGAGDGRVPHDGPRAAPRVPRGTGTKDGIVRL